MKAAVRSLDSPDIPDLAHFVPAAPDDFAFLLEILVGPEDAPGEESFDVFVCTPNWLIHNHQPSDIIEGPHKLIVFEYDFGRLSDFITRWVNACEAPSWQALAEKIGRLGKWEFEDYQELPSSAKSSPMT
jgi:hypothetical protein